MKEKDYRGANALEIVRAMERDAANYPFQGQSIRQFLRWSLASSGKHFPPRETDLSDRIKEEELALNYLYLCDEYGFGKFLSETENGCGNSFSCQK
jgi:hypothetical protein